MFGGTLQNYAAPKMYYYSHKFASFTLIYTYNIVMWLNKFLQVEEKNHGNVAMMLRKRLLHSWSN
jgi:hypothetical protein